MKLFRTIFVAAIFAMLMALTVCAQGSNQRRQGASPAQGGGIIPEGKVALIDSDAFADPKTGIKRLISALTVVDREFQGRREEIEKLTQRYNEMIKNIDLTKTVADQKTLTAKADEAEALKLDIERKQRAGQSDLEKRVKELTDPIYQDIAKSLQAYAQQRGINLLFDVSKMGSALFVVSDKIDVTQGFIADYNQRNPIGNAPGGQQ